MKKLIIFLFAVLLGISASTQDKTITLNNGRAWNLSRNGVRFVWTGTDADTLTPNIDSVLFILRIGDMNRNNRPLHFALNISSKGITGTDTTFVVHSDYRISTTNTTYSELVPNITSSVNTVAGINTTVTSYGIISDFTTVQTVASYDAVTVAYDISVQIDTLTSDTVGVHANFITLGKDETVAEQTMTVAQQTFTITNKQNPQLHYRYMSFLLIIEGDDSIGEGIELDELEIIFDL